MWWKESIGYIISKRKGKNDSMIMDGVNNVFVRAYAADVFFGIYGMGKMCGCAVASGVEGTGNGENG